MKASGISIYPGMGVSLELYKNYLSKAKQANFEYIFMSLHIPEANSNLEVEFLELLNFANQLKMKVIVDISKPMYEKFDFTKFPIYGLRLDFGFTSQEIVKIVNDASFKIYLNASTINSKEFQELEDLKINLLNLGVFHNFYPKPYSGLGRDFIKKQNTFFKSKGLEILAFVASHFMPRQPLEKGLPTIENHRYLNPLIQFQELWFLGSDINCFGDLMASDQELKLVSQLKEDELLIPIKINHELL